jgi:uncharacterized membrane protein YdbT with pleckstrin-like domain
MARLLRGEAEIRTARQHWSVFLPVVTSCVVILGVGFFLLKVAPHSVAGRDLHQVKVVIGLVLVLFCGALFLLRYLRWRFTTYTLTTTRILMSSGILSRTTESIVLDRVQDVVVRQSLLGRLFGAGDVEVESAGRSGSEVFHLLADPMGFSDALHDAVEAYRRGGADASAPTAPNTTPPPESRGDGVG